MSDFIFVYGTLLSTVPSVASKWLSQHAQLIGEVTFPGTLYDLGSYPGFVTGAAASGEVAGEVYQLYDRMEAFRFLDKYEGLDAQEPLYRRGELLHPDYGRVWTYIYQGETNDLPIIVGGDYRKYYDQQARHRLFIQSGE